MKGNQMWFQTRKGNRVDTEDILDRNTTDWISIGDIAHSLANQCRYLGHCPRFYSVAQHSVIMANAAPPEIALWCLFHDASEAYLGDLPPYIKHAPFMNRYRVAHYELTIRIGRKLGLGNYPVRQVKDYDLRMLATELRDLIGTDGPWKQVPGYEPLERKIVPVSPLDAEGMFLDAATRLFDVKRSAVPKS